MLHLVGNISKGIYVQCTDLRTLNSASCWKYITRNILTMHGPLNVKFKLILLLFHYVFDDAISTSLHINLAFSRLKTELVIV